MNVDKWAGILILALMTIFSSPAIAQTTDIHIMSLRVLVDGKEIMTPNVQMLPGSPGYLSVSDAGDQPLYSLQLEIVPDVDIGGAKGLGFNAVLWKGPFNSGEKEIDSVSMISPKPTKINGPMKISMQGRDGKSVEIEIISHAVEQRDLSSLNINKASCIDGSGRIIPKNKPSQSTPSASTSCCGGPCAPPSNQHYQCCGFTACCVCGRCCAVP